MKIKVFETKIPIPSEYIPKDYIGEKFGVLLVFVKGKNKTEIKKKVANIKREIRKLK